MSKRTTTTVKEGKAQFTHFVRVAEAGGRVVITRNGKPVADIVPHEEAKPPIRSRFEAIAAYKKAHGLPDEPFSYVAPDFDDPLPEDFLFTSLPEDFEHNLRKNVKRS